MTQQARKVNPAKVPAPVKKVLEWDDLSPEQQQIVIGSQQPGVFLPAEVKTAEQYRAWIKSRTR